MSEMKILQADGTLTRAGLLSDKGISVGFALQESAGDDLTKIREFFQMYGRLYFVTSAEEIDMHKLTLEEPEGKKSKWTMSQRLRLAIKRLADAKGEVYEEYYRSRMAAFVVQIEQETDELIGYGGDERGDGE